MKKAISAYDLAHQRRTPSTADLKFRNPMKYQSNTDLNETPPKGNISKNDSKHKVVIYFSDAYNNICNKVSEGDNGIDRNRSVAGNVKILKEHQNSSKEFMAQLKTVLEEKSKFTNKFSDPNCNGEVARVAANKFKPPVLKKPSYSSMTSMLQINQSSKSSVQQDQQNKNSEKNLPSFIESIDENNVIKLKIEQNFRRASELVNLISSLPKKNGKKYLKKNKHNDVHDSSSIHELNFSNGKCCLKIC